jgi:hypothetical protein
VLYHLSHSTSPVLCWVFSKNGIMNYLPRLASNLDPPISASWVARIIGVSHQHPVCSGYFGDGFSRTICLGWPWATIFPIPASQIARTTGVSHWHLALFQVFNMVHPIVHIKLNLAIILEAFSTSFSLWGRISGAQNCTNHNTCSQDTVTSINIICSYV